jgi:sterol desaturase/sphingolipid hydroxylase (fatty acid hydroxylase superfamily)
MEELSKIKRNFVGIIISFILTIIIYGGMLEIGKFIWPFLLAHTTPFLFAYLGPQIWHFLLLVVFHTFLLVLYRIKHPFFEKYRYLESWPWEEDPKAWAILANKTFWNYIINQCFVAPAFGYCFSLIGEGYRKDIETFPTLYEMLGQIIIFDVINDFLLWLEHVILHIGPLYRSIHKVHHEYNNVVGISGEYFHPLEFVFFSIVLNSGPKMWGSRTHLFTFFMWQTTRIYDNIIQNHSGFMFPWRPLGMMPFQNGHAYHYYHHSENVGNYAFNYNIFDHIFGWDKHFRKAKKEGRYKNLKAE